MTSYTTVLIKSLAIALLIAITGATGIALMDKEFRTSYSRIVDALVTGTLGAVSMYGATKLDEKKRRPEDEPPTTSDLKEG